MDDHYSYHPSTKSGNSSQDTLVVDSTIVFDRLSSPSVLKKDPPLVPSMVVSGLSIDSTILVSGVDSIAIVVSLSPPLAPFMVVAGPSLDSIVLVLFVDVVAIFVNMSPPLAPSMVAASPSLDFVVLVSSMDFTANSICLSCLKFLMVDPLLAPSMVTTSPSFGVSKTIHLVVPFLRANV